MRVSVRTTAVAVLTVASSGLARAQGDTLHHDSAAVAPTAAPVAPVAAPASVSGFELIQQTTLPGAVGGQWYRYVHDKFDTVDVVVSPYDPAIRLGNGDDSSQYTFQQADQFRFAYDQAYRSGVYSAYRLDAPRTDPIHVNGVPVHGYLLQAVFTRRSTGVTRYTFFAAYATPRGLVRIKAEVPRNRGYGITFVNFSHALLDKLVP
jgi:hypothetical protein